MEPAVVQVPRANLDKWLCKRKTRDKICPSSLVQVQVSPENSRTLIFSSSGCLVILKSGISLRAGAPRFQAGPDSRQAPIPGRPRLQLHGGNPNLDKKLGQGTWINFITCFPLTEPLVQVRPGNLDKELGQLRAAVLQALSVLRPDSRQAIPCALPRRKPELGQELGQGTWFYHVFSSYRATCPSSPGELGQGTWTTADKLSQYYAPLPIPCTSLFRGRFPNGFYST